MSSTKKQIDAPRGEVGTPAMTRALERCAVLAEFGE
jgi:hypothetical protein